MRFREHSELEGRHALLSPSQPHWLRYSDEKLIERQLSAKAAQRGTELHELAATCINLGVKLQGKKTIAAYVNDAINYRMTPEQKLYFSENCFGTADAISFERKLLRIHDLKTGTIPASMEQLEIYAALFCLEYQYKPSEIRMELRIYQNNEVVCFEPTVADILPIMDRIVHADKVLSFQEQD